MLMVRYNDMPKDEFYVFFSNKVSFKAGLDKIAVSYGYYREPKTGNMEGIQGVMMSELSKLSYNDLFTK
jgi:hypothetical protein